MSCNGTEFRSVILVLFQAGKIFGWPLPLSFYITLFCKHVHVFLKTTIDNILSPEFHGQGKRELECPKLETSFTSVFDIFFVCSPLLATFEWILLKETRIFCKWWKISSLSQLLKKRHSVWNWWNASTFSENKIICATLLWGSGWGYLENTKH